MVGVTRQANVRRRILVTVTDSLPPVAIRVVRPYASDDELLENELETLTRTSVTLLGAQPRPPGLVLRFELVLSSGQTLVRGEGRVVGYKPNAHLGIGGLTLRFTRLDTRSKAFVDKAAALRERRRPSAGQPAEAPRSIPPAPPSDQDRSSALSGPDLPPSLEAPPRAAPTSVLPPAIARSPSAAPPAIARSPSVAPPAIVQSASVAPPALAVPATRDRDALLERLRARSKALGTRIDALFDRRR